MISEIFVEGNQLDLTADISSLLTFALDDIKNFASRSTTFSKTIVLPGTANNNAIFGNIFATGISNDHDTSRPNIGYNFNASKSARAYIFQDNLQTFKGTLRLIEIVRDKRRIEYEVALNGELTGLSVALSSGLLEDLDFSEHDMLWTPANIVASWDNTPGSGVYYPMIDYGTYSTDKHNWKIGTFRPALYVKEYIDKMFAAANYSYLCPLFQTDRFKGLVIPHNQKQLQALNTDLLSATRTTDVTMLTSAGISEKYLEFEAVDTSIFTASILNSEFTYTGTTVSTSFAFDIKGYYRSLVTDFTLQILKNGTPIALYTKHLASNHNASFTLPFSWNETIPLSRNTGDQFRFKFIADSSGSDTNYLLTVTDADFTVNSASGVLTPVLIGDTVQMNQAIPKNIRQVDFLLSIVKLFNLYVYESKWDERVIIISPFVSFYDGTAVDWTYKMNRDQPRKIRPMSELNSKLYNFNYRDDNDYYNELYKKRYNLTYGSHVFDSEFEFASQASSLDLIFASTPLVGYAGEDKVYPTIFKRSGSDTVIEENVDCVIRIMQTKKKVCTAFNILDGVSVVASPTTYGYAGHFDDPDNPDNDLNFGIVREYFYLLTIGDISNTQFNLYWSAYMAEITSKDSKLMIAKFYLTPKDIFNLDFRTYVYVDGVLWRINKISDYNATKPGLCTVELLRVIHNTFGFPPGAIPGHTPDNSLLWKDGDPILWDAAATDELLYS